MKLQTGETSCWGDGVAAGSEGVYIGRRDDVDEMPYSPTIARCV